MKISLIIIRKLDHCPMGIYYLGDERRKAAILGQWDSMLLNLQGDIVKQFRDAEHVTGLLRAIGVGIPLEFIEGLRAPDDFAYWVRVQLYE